MVVRKTRNAVEMAVTVKKKKIVQNKIAPVLKHATKCLLECLLFIDLFTLFICRCGHDCFCFLCCVVSIVSMLCEAIVMESSSCQDSSYIQPRCCMELYGLVLAHNSLAKVKTAVHQ